MLADPTGRRWYDMIQVVGQTAVGVATEVIASFSAGEFLEALASMPGTPLFRDAWQVAIDAAEEYNEPGVYTAFQGFEWTSNKAGITASQWDGTYGSAAPVGIGGYVRSDSTCS